MNSSYEIALRGLCKYRSSTVAFLCIHFIYEKIKICECWSFQLFQLKILCALLICHYSKVLLKPCCYLFTIIYLFFIPIEIITEAAKILFKVYTLYSQNCIIVKILLIRIFAFKLYLFVFWRNKDLFDFETFVK